MGTMGHFLLSVLIVILVLGGPFTLFALIKIANRILGGLSIRFSKTALVDGKENSDAPLSLTVCWDEESYPHEIVRVKTDVFELFANGRSSTFSYTFPDKSAKKKSFSIPLKLNEEDYKILTDEGPNNTRSSLKKTAITVEVEFKDGGTRRFKLNKKPIRRVLSNQSYATNFSSWVNAQIAKLFKKLNLPHEGIDRMDQPEKLDILAPTEPDAWSVLTRVFPWRAESEDEGEKKKKSAGPAAAAGGPRAPVDFNVTKVWIEPGCIVCDACEIEAPKVFDVLEDTCIVKEDADLTDGAAIKAAAEGCPVDVIKFDTVPKTAAG